MFKFLKEKLKGWFKFSEEKVEKEAEKEEKPRKKPEKIESIEQIEEKIETEIKEKKKKKHEKEEERKISGKIIEDIKKEHPGEEIRSVPRIEDLQVKEKKQSIFQKLTKIFAYKISEADFEEIFSNLETLLLENNVALEVVEEIKKQLKASLLNKEIKKDSLEKEIKNSLKNAIESLLLDSEDVLWIVKQKTPFVIVFFGINGSGKTTSIAKFANLLKKNKISCVLAASDTFRAASIEQLKIHGEKLGIKVIAHQYGADPAAVAFDAIKHAQAHNIQAVLIDTAGRMHTKDSLMKEMEKIVRVAKPDLKIFVAESIAGNDTVEQARVFNQAIGIDGIILSKQDVDEKGGTSLSVSYITKRPIFYLGTGQNYKDLESFNKKKFIRALGL